MSKHQITDSDIVDVLLGQASSQVEGAVQKALQTDADFATAYDEWTQILAAAKSEAQRLEATAQRVCENVMERVGQEQRPQTIQVPVRRVFRTGWLLGLGWRRTLAPLAAAVVVCLIGAIIVPGMYPKVELVQLERRVTYVDFAARTVEEGGSRELPYRTLGKAVQAAPEGGIIVIRPSIAGVTLSETIRIAKPLRLEVESGKVRVGKE